MQHKPKYYREALAILKESLGSSFGAAQAIGRLMVNAARGKRAAKELLALREKWAKEHGEAPDHQAVHCLDYKGISELADDPILSEQDLEALGKLLERISKLQADNAFLWENNRIKTGEWLEYLAWKISALAHLKVKPEQTKDLLEELAKEMERIGKILAQTVPWEDQTSAMEEVWEAKKETQERVNKAVKEVFAQDSETKEEASEEETSPEAA